MVLAYTGPGCVGRSNIFAQWQPSYAAHHIATFPLRGDKVPAIRGYNRVGLRASGQLAAKYPDADALGFLCGARSKITVLDCDATDDNILSDALARHGATPLVVRTASGKWHAYYKHNGERRRIRPWKDQPLDVLGGGVAVAPPSRIARGRYQIVQGSLDDLDRLPVMGGLDEPFYARAARIEQNRSAAKTDIVAVGQRNRALFTHCMRNAGQCVGFADLIAVAERFNANCNPPLDADEVLRIAKNAWSYTHQGRNRFGQHGAWFPTDEVIALTAPGSQDLAILLMVLRGQNSPNATFMVANGMAKTLGWDRERFAKVRKVLIEIGYVREVRSPSSGYGPALYRWA
jgi:Bifunctional DNA primase/polymerase, N-terminal/Primase C terminal 1 (PriCT-1)